MKKIKYTLKRLATEYQTTHKPDRRRLMKDTVRIAGTAFIGAVVLKLVDTGFAALLGLVL